MPKNKKIEFDDEDHDEALVDEEPLDETDSKEKRKRKRKRAKTTNTTEVDGADGDAIPSGGDSLPKQNTLSSDIPASAAAFVNDRTVYIEGLPFTAKDTDVREFFKSVKKGSIVSLRLPTWHDSGNLRGYGHVEFQNSAAAKEAMTLDGAYMGKRFIKVSTPMVPRILQKQQEQQQDPSKVVRPAGCRTIFVKNLPYDTNEEEIIEAFKVCGKIQSVRIPVWGHTNQQKGAAYIDFKREESAEIAVKKGMVIRGRPLSLDFETGAPKMSFKSGDSAAKFDKK